MKHPKKPTREQRRLMQRWRLDTYDWLVTKDTSTELVLVNRYSDLVVKVIPKGGDAKCHV